MPHIFERLFTRAGKKMQDYLELQELRPHWRNFFEDGTTIDLYPTGGETAAANEALTNADGRELDRFLEYSRDLYESSLPSYFEQGIDTFWGMMKYHGYFRALREFDALKTVDGGVRRYVTNPYLVDVLNYFVKYVGSSP